MKIAKFILDYDSRGPKGYVLEGVDPNLVNPAKAGILLAHDVFEHQQGPEEIGYVVDELVALGGVWATRGEVENIDGKWNQTIPYGVGELCGSFLALGGDIEECCYASMIGGITLPKWSVRPTPEDDAFHFLVNEVVPKNFSDEPETVQQKTLLERLTWLIEDSRDVERLDSALKEFRERCPSLLKKGYRLCYQRAKHVGGIENYRSNFWALSDVLSKELPRAFGDEIETIKVGYGKGRAEVLDMACDYPSHNFGYQ